MTDWTKDEEEILIRIYPEHGVPGCRKMLPQKTDGSIGAKVKRMGLTRSNNKKQSIPDLGAKAASYDMINQFLGSRAVLVKSERVRHNVKLLRMKIKTMTDDQTIARANATIKNLRAQL